MKIKLVQSCSNLGVCIAIWDYGINDYLKLFNNTDCKGIERALWFCKDTRYKVVVLALSTSIKLCYIWAI